MSTLHLMQELKMLLIDDDDSIRTSLNFYFGKKGVSFKSFATAELALDYLGESDADLVITDYLLPGLNGLEFIRRLNGFKPNIMKILITAYGNLDIAMEAVELGIYDFIRKPFNTKTIETAILALMKRDAGETNRFFLDGRRMELPGTSPAGSDCSRLVSPSFFYGLGTAESGLTRRRHEARTVGNLPCIISKARRMHSLDKELLNELISTCVDFSHPREWVDINCIIRESINACSARAEFDSIEICFETGGGPSMIKTNRDHLHDIIHNILTNSIRGLRTVSIPRKKIGIAVKSSESARSIIITDNGKRVQPASSEEAEPEDIETNTGVEELELLILGMLAERIGASLHIHNKSEEGTTMEIAFRLQTEVRNETMP